MTCSDNNQHFNDFHRHRRKRNRVVVNVMPSLLFCASAFDQLLAQVAVPSQHSKNVIDKTTLRGHRRSTNRQRRVQSNSTISGGNLVVYNYCGIDWSDANSKCTTSCPTGDSDPWCPWGESCFADVTSCPSIAIAATATTVANVHSVTPTVSVNVESVLSVNSAALSCQQPANTVNIGYYQSWARYRPAPDCYPLLPSEIDVSKFQYTHLIYSFAGITNDGLLGAYNGASDEYTFYAEFNDLKKMYPELKTLLAVGGWNLDQTLFSQKVAYTTESRTKFANSVVDLMTQYNFDGIDLDWEYPVTRQGSEEDYQNFVLLAEAIRLALDSSSPSSPSSDKYLITAAIPSNIEKLESGYNLTALATHVDWFHLMSYDIFGAWDQVAGSNTDMPSVESTVNYILSCGVDSAQLVLGMAAYGRGSHLAEEGCTTAGCPISGAAITGCSGELGFLPFFEIKENYIDTGNYESLLYNQDTGSMEMILAGDEEESGGKVFVSLDVAQSWEVKRQFSLDKCLRGQMWWAIDMIKDPPFGSLDPQAVTTSIDSNVPTNITLPSNITTANIPSPSLTIAVTAPGIDQDDAYCNGEDGLVPIENCEGFVFCANGKMSGTKTLCSTGLIFDANMGICNWPSETNLCGFEFCHDGFSGYVSFEECSKFYYCKVGKIDGDIETCPEGTLFDEGTGICNWSSMVTCNTKVPTSLPTIKMSPGPTFGTVALTIDTETTPNPSQLSQNGTADNETTPPTYANVHSSMTNLSMISPGAMHSKATTPPSQNSSATILRFDPTDDAYIQEAKPHENWNDEYIVIDQNLRFDGLLRFYVQGIGNRTVSNVKLKLFVSQSSEFGGKFYACKDNWHEDVVTWDTAPSIISQKPLAVVNAVPENEWIEINITGLVIQDGPVALRITSDVTDNVMYSSKENSNMNAPQLIVEVDSATIVEKSLAINTFKIGPTDDAFVFKTNANKNFGRHSGLKVDMDNGLKKTYLRFDLSRVSVEAIKNATIRLFTTDSSPSGGTLVVTSETEWNENSITYNNSPKPDGIVIGSIGEAVKDQWIEVNIMHAITESGPLSICILGNHDDRVMYSSKEGQHSPEIILELQEILPTEGEVMELIPTDDATIILQQPDSNFGSGMRLQTDLVDGMRNFLLRFDASDIPQGQVKSAIIRIFAENELPAFGGTFVEMMDPNWKEQTVTWNNAPMADGQVLGSISDVENGSWYDLDVTNAVIGGRPVSFRISSPKSGIAVYGSKESNHKPKMIVQYTPQEPLPEGYEIFHPTDDASILMEKPLANFGLDGKLQIDGDSGVYNSLLRFDLTPIEQDTITEAILRLYAVDGSPSGGTFISTQNTQWNQASINWSSAPVADGVVLTTLGVVTPYKWYEIDVTKIARGGEPISIRIAASHGNRCAFSSSEDINGHSPQLLIKSDLFEGME